MSKISSSDGISLYCSREMIAASESNNGFHSFNGKDLGGNGNDGLITYRRSSFNDLDDLVDDDDGDTGRKHMFTIFLSGNLSQILTSY